MGQKPAMRPSRILAPTAAELLCLTAHYPVVAAWYERLGARGANPCRHISEHQINSWGATDPTAQASGVLLKQRPEALLSEVAVGRQRLIKTIFVHEDEADRVA